MFLDSVNKIFSTKEGSTVDDDSYLGYSSITGDFNGDGTEGVAVGMPRGSDLLGKVMIFTQELELQKNITGEQLGAYFGYSLCAVDVNGDSLVDLVVGAPMYSDVNNDDEYETGRVYIMLQGSSVTYYCGLYIIVLLIQQYLTE